MTWARKLRYLNATQPGRILLSHETFSLVKNTVRTEEQAPVQAKGFAEPLRNYRVVDNEDRLDHTDHVIFEEKAGVRIFLDLRTLDRSSTIKSLKDLLVQLGEKPDTKNVVGTTQS